MTSESTLPRLRTDFHLLSKGSPKKVIIKSKSNRGKDIHRIFLNKSKLKALKPDSKNLPGKRKVFINESLCFSTRNCGPNVKPCGMLVKFSRIKTAMDGWESSCPMILYPWSHMIVIWKVCFRATHWLKITS